MNSTNISEIIKQSDDFKVNIDYESVCTGETDDSGDNLKSHKFTVSYDFKSNAKIVSKIQTENYLDENETDYKQSGLPLNKQSVSSGKGTIEVSFTDENKNMFRVFHFKVYNESVDTQQDFKFWNNTNVQSYERIFRDENNECSSASASASESVSSEIVPRYEATHTIQQVCVGYADGSSSKNTENQLARVVHPR